MESIILLACLIVLVLLGAPIGFTLIALPVVYIVFFEPSVPLNLIPTQMFDVLDSVTLTAIPFFMLTGELMSTGKITDRLVEVSARIIGRVRGSLAQVNILVSMFFAGMNGSVVADTVTVGSLLIPAMKLRGYEPEYAAALTAVSATIGGIIPPSIAMVILANAGGLSVGALFAEPHHPYTSALLAALPESAEGRRRLPTIPGVVPGLFDRPSGCLFSPRCSFADDRCRQHEPPKQPAIFGSARCHYPLSPSEGGREA